ncbi:MAG: RDD family protein [Firmicutes bacterium]|nr:RDD family protein [Bacillota bacterium]
MNIQNNISKRLIAYLLDAFFVYLLIYLISGIQLLNPTYNKLLEVSETYNEAVEAYKNEEISEEEYFEINKTYIYDATRYNVSTNIIFVVAVFAYYGLFQKYNKGQTLGKKIMKIKVTTIDDKEPSLGKYCLRILPMYYILLGSVIPFALSSILVFIMSASNFSVLYSFLVYGFVIIGIISFIIMYSRKDKRGLHDLIAGTKVVIVE